MQLSDDKKMRVLYRVEPGCLGPTGTQYIEAFCRFANKQITSPHYAQLLFLPRYDKQKDERQYSVNSRNLSQLQAKMYLQHFSVNIVDFEDQLDQLLTKAIDLYFKR